MQGRGKTLTLMLLLATMALFGAMSQTPANDEPRYERGMEALDRGDWREAADHFGAVADARGDRADAALYWQAYAQHKRGATDQARRTLDRLDRDYPESRWQRDARALAMEMDGRRSGRDDDDELKLLALQGLMHADPERAIPVLRQFIEGDHSSDLKEQALFVLLQSGHPEARSIVASLAKDDREDTDLREDAVVQLGLFGDEESLALLEEVYRSSRDEDIREAVLEAYMVSGESERLLAVARDERSEDLREEAIEYLGAMGAGDALEELYTSERSEDLRETLLEAFMISGQHERILDAARNESSEEVRETAVELLGAMGANDELWELYEDEPSEEVRETILESLMVSGDTAHLYTVARDDPSEELRATAVEMLGVAGARSELERLWSEERSEDVREEILHGFMIMGAREPILEAARNDPSEELRGEAIQLLGVMGATADLRQLYDSERSEDLREEIVQALTIAGEVDFLAEIATGDGPVHLRVEAIEAMGVSGGKRAPGMLADLYDTDRDPEIREAVIEALFHRGAVRELIHIARNETDSELRLEAVRHLSHMSNDEAEDFMMELLEE